MQTHKHRFLSNNKEIEPVYGLKHRKKFSNKKCIKSKSSSVKEMNHPNYDGDHSFTKSRSKNCLHKEIARLVEENRLLSAKLSGEDVNLGKL